MVASKQVEIPIYKSTGRQRERGFGALAKVIGRSAFPFLRKNSVPAAKCVSAVLPDFAVPQIADVVSGTKISTQLQRVWEDKF